MVVGKNNKKITKGEWEKYLVQLEDPKNNKEVNYDLPENPTALQVAKYEICQRILSYQQDNKISDKKLADKTGLSIPELEEILFCQIDKFTLDRLLTYANCLFSPSQVKVTITTPLTRSKRSAVYAS